MKRFYRMSIALGCAVLLTACSSGQDVKGSGAITTQARDIPSFKKIDIKGDFNVMVSRRWPQKIDVSTDTNLQSYVLTVVKDGTLTIMPKHGFNIKPSGPIMIKIAARDIDEIKAKGNNIVNATGLNSNEFEFKSEGSMHANLAGRVDKADIEVEGASKLDARNLMAKDVDLDVKGAAKTQVYATKKLDVKITGKGEVTYFGKPPVVNQAIFGGGMLKAGKKSS